MLNYVNTTTQKKSRKNGCFLLNFYTKVPPEFQLVQKEQNSCPQILPHIVKSIKCRYNRYKSIGALRNEKENEKSHSALL